ncbi:hypothetical protein [Alkalihalobacterium bogoriense]|uniref:hypothetical protein n=1 Tax=Alkalihalobacterium bogoriense TaxID=246272 RepID=UPI00047ADC8E|nr:hypothetical protein [Alkalihalobacterium bogoriense]
MKTIIKLQLSQFFTAKISILLFGSLLIAYGELLSTASSYEVFILMMLTDHYYITYFLVPLYLLFFYKSLRTDVEIILIRMTHFWRSFLAKGIAAFLQAFGFISIQMVVLFLLSLKLEKTNEFPLQYSVENELAHFYSQYFSTPWNAIVLVALFMVIGLTTVSVIMLAIYHFFNERITAIVVICLYIIMTFGIKIPTVSEWPFLTINNYIIMHHNFSYEGKLVVTIVSMVCTYGVIALLVKRYWQLEPNINWKLYPKGMTSFYSRQLFTRKNLYLCLGFIVVFSLWKATHTINYQGSAVDYFTILFYGHGSNQFHLISFLEMLIMHGIPLYLLAIFIEEERRDRNLAITVRLKRKITWLYNFLGTCIGFIAFYVISLILIGILVGGVFEFNGAIWGLAVKIGLLKFLDIVFQFSLLFIIYVVSKKVTLAFLTVLATSVGSIWFAYIPSGISSIARSEAWGGFSYFVNIGILLVSICFLFSYIRLNGYKNIFT